MAHKKNNTNLTELLLQCVTQPDPMLSMLEQLRTIDKDRVLGYLGKISTKEMLNVDKALMLSLAL